MFLFALSPTNNLACGIGVSTQKRHFNIWQLCWRGQGMKGHETHIDLICVERKSHTRKKRLAIESTWGELILSGKALLQPILCQGDTWPCWNSVWVELLAVPLDWEKVVKNTARAGMSLQKAHNCWN